MRRCERRCEDEKVWEKVWRGADVKRSRCEDEQMWEKMWRWADVKMSRCEDEEMWRWAGVKMSRCEDEKVWEKVWRWEGVKMWRWDTDPHYWKNPALRRSREKKHMFSCMGEINGFGGSAFFRDLCVHALSFHIMYVFRSILPTSHLTCRYDIVIWHCETWQITSCTLILWHVGFAISMFDSSTDRICSNHHIMFGRWRPDGFILSSSLKAIYQFINDYKWFSTGL